MLAGTFLRDDLLGFRNTDLLLFVFVPEFSFGLLLMLCEISPSVCFAVVVVDFTRYFVFIFTNCS